MILQSSGEIFTTEEIEILEEYGEPSSPGTYYYGACVDAVTGSQRRQTTVREPWRLK